MSMDLITPIEKYVGVGELDDKRLEECIKSGMLDSLGKTYLGKYGTRKQIKLNKVKLGFHNLVKPELVNIRQKEFWKPNYKAKFILTKEEHQEEINEILKTTKVLLALHKHKNERLKNTEPNPIRYFYDQDKSLADGFIAPEKCKEHLKNKVMITGENSWQSKGAEPEPENPKQKPELWFKGANQKIRIATDQEAEQIFEPGHYVNAILTLYTYEFGSKQFGVNCAINKVLFAKYGQPFSNPFQNDDVENVFLDDAVKLDCDADNYDGVPF